MQHLVLALIGAIVSDMNITVDRGKHPQPQNELEHCCMLVSINSGAHSLILDTAAQ